MQDERRSEDSKLNAIMELMSVQHGATLSMMAQNREHFTRRLDDLGTRFDSEIPDGHGVYHAELIASAARQQAFREAVKHRVGGWAAVGVLAALAAWSWDWITSHYKP